MKAVAAFHLEAVQGLLFKRVQESLIVGLVPLKVCLQFFL